MNKNQDPLKELSAAYDSLRDSFEHYIAILSDALAFDSGNPKDPLGFVGTFAGFCDRVDEAKFLTFKEFQNYAGDYYDHFKNASEEAQESQRTNGPTLRADDDLIEYVTSSESEEQFWENLISESANIAYLWGTATSSGKGYFQEQFNKIDLLVRNWHNLNAELQKRLEETAESKTRGDL